MSKLTSAIGSMLVATLLLGCHDNPVAPDAHTPSALRTATPSGPSAQLGVPNRIVENHQPVCVPFRTNGSPGSVEITGGPPPAPLEITIDAGGHATLLGRYSSSASGVITFPSPTQAVFDGGGSFTAANGDEIWFEYFGDFFPGPVPGGLGEYEIRSGTGRFEGATGAGLFSSEGGSTTFDGTICLARK